jgi:hypothetical protein
MLILVLAVAVQATTLISAILNVSQHVQMDIMVIITLANV